MKLQVRMAPQLKGTFFLPASKSYSIRAFIIAACGGQSNIVRPSNCDDAKVALNMAKVLGANVSKSGPETWTVQAGHLKTSSVTVNVKESGTALRFLLPLLCLDNRAVTITGEGTLKGRPNHFLTKVLREQGIDIEGQGPKESVPIKIKGGQMKGGIIQIDGTLSSQFISALLITCPRLAQNTQIRILGKTLVSSDYIIMTRQVLDRAGVKIISKGPRRYDIKGGQRFKGLKKFTVPSDYGLAAFHLAGAVLLPSNVTLKGYLNDDFIQADGHIIPLLKRMGVTFQKTKTSIKIKGPRVLKGGSFSLKDCPDLVPIMSVLALFADRPTRLYNIGHARVKESDRISDLRQELLKVGAKIKETKNELFIYPQKEYKTNCTLDPHHDHRLAMAFSVLGLKQGVTVKDIECVSKSYPDFVKDFKSLGVKTTKIK